MWIYSLLFFNMIMGQESVSQSAPVQLETSASIQEHSTGQKPWSLFGELSFEGTRRQLGEQRIDKNPGVQNFSVGLKYQFQSGFSGTFELLGEQTDEETDVYFGQMFLDYQSPFLQGLHLLVGHKYYSYGVLTGMEGLFSRRPDYYDDLLVTRRGMDVGAEVIYQPLAKLPLQVSYSLFAGRTLRPGDGNLEPAEENPQYVQLAYRPSFLTAQLTGLSRRYRNRPQLNAWGLSVESSRFSLWKGNLRLSGMGEYWNLNYRRSDGFERVGETASLGSYVEAFGFFHRSLLSQENWSSPGSVVNQNQFTLHGLGFCFTKKFFFEYQNIVSKEQAGGFQMTTVNEEAWRVYFKL